MLQDKKEKMSVNNMRYKFERKTLRFRDMFSEVLFYMNKFWLHMKCYKPEKVDRMALEMMSESQQFVKRAYTAYESDICVESIIRSIKKLESGLAAVIGNDTQKIKDSKLLYYSNSINFSDKTMRDRCRATNEFLDYL